MNERVDVFDLMDLPEPAAMNADLEGWAREQNMESDFVAPDETRGAHVTGPCALCDAAAMARCLRCESAICSSHHHVMTGVCDRCVQASGTAKRGPGEGEGSDADYQARLGLDISWID